MKHITTLIVGLLILPSFSSAAPLTIDQANSLISVVQSSTTTPASAFVPLITSFSSITVAQAESLITVVKAAPGVPANAFVNMLIAFTVDTAPIVQPIAPVVTPTQPTLGSTQTVDTAPVVVAPVVQSVVMDKSDIVIVDIRQRPADAKANQPFGSVQLFVSVLDAEGNQTESEVTMDAPDNIYGVLAGLAQRYEKGWRFGSVYVPTSIGTKTVTFTSGTLTKTLELTF